MDVYAIRAARADSSQFRLGGDDPQTDAFDRPRLTGRSAGRVHLERPAVQNPAPNDPGRLEVGSVAVFAEAKDNTARSFYKRYGFRSLLDAENRLFLPIATIS